MSSNPSTGVPRSQRTAHPLGTTVGPYAYSYCRVLRGAVSYERGRGTDDLSLVVQVTILDPKEDKPVIQAPKGADEKPYAAPTMGGGQPTARY